MINKKAQSILAYAVLFAIIIAVLAAMSSYVRRSLQGKIKESADVFGGGTQYEPETTRETP